MSQKKSWDEERDVRAFQIGTCSWMKLWPWEWFLVPCTLIPVPGFLSMPCHVSFFDVLSLSSECWSLHLHLSGLPFLWSQLYPHPYRHVGSFSLIVRKESTTSFVGVTRWVCPGPSCILTEAILSSTGSWCPWWRIPWITQIKCG